MSEFNPTKEAGLMEDAILVALRDADLITPEAMDKAFKSEAVADMVREHLAEAYHQGCADARKSAIMALGGDP